jgi:hypothetical protein
MGAVGGHIQTIVEKIDGAGDQAERDQTHGGIEPRSRIEPKGEQGRCIDKQIFGPLAWTAGLHQSRNVHPGGKRVNDEWRAKARNDQG